MSKRSAYEDALSGKMEEVPLPDEDASWSKMKNLLDEDDDRGFWFFKDYRVLGLLTLLLIGWGIWLMNSQLDGKKNAARDLNGDGGRTAQRIERAQTTNNARLAEKAPGVGTAQTLPVPISTIFSDSLNAETLRTSDTSRISGYKISALNLPSDNTKNLAEKQTVEPKKIIVFRKPGQSFSINNPDAETTSATLRNKRSNQLEKKGTLKQESQTIKNEISGEDEIINELHQAIINKADTDFKSSVQIIPKKKNRLFPDSTIVIQKTTIDSLSDKKQVVKLSKPSSRKYLLSAGLGIQQQIQIGGQRQIEYGYKATSLISDYIPSAWINFGKKDKWFLQTGFVYSSPQLVKEFAFNRQTKADTFSTVTNTLILKKTFYSQLPLSFNYYVKPNWSVGAGMTITWLRGAIAEKETKIKNTSSQTPVVSRQIMPINSFTDSFLYRSHSFFTVQSDYEWKRVSFGLKYTKDLQSYIKYTMPDGTVVEDRNWGLQAVLRVRLWQRSSF